MKIAVAGMGENVAQHFGHCEVFHLFETEGKSIVSFETVANPGHRPGFLPVFLYEKGAKVVISGGMGGGAIDIFNEKGIEVVVGAQGNAKQAVTNYLNGSLKTTGAVCNAHEHEGDCN